MGPLHPAEARFKLGQVVSTKGALSVLEEAGVRGQELLMRHAAGDWGDIAEEDQGLNERALECGERILSVYNLPTGKTIWIITEANRSATTFLLPEEY